MRLLKRLLNNIWWCRTKTKMKIFMTLGNTMQERFNAYLAFAQQDTSESVLARVRDSINRGVAFADAALERAIQEKINSSRPKKRGRPRTSIII